MTPQEIITELAEGAADLHPLIERVKRSVTRIGDAELERDVKEMISLNARTWTAVAELMHYAQIEIQKKKGVIMDPAFEVHMLTDEGKIKAEAIAQSFDRLLTELRSLVPSGRELAITVTKLEEAAFFAKKGMAKANSK